MALALAVAWAARHTSRYGCGDERLAQRTGDQSLVDQFLGASQLEVNYVPGGLPADQIEFCLEQAANFVEHVEALLGEG